MLHTPSLHIGAIRDARHLQTGELNRREFLARATSLGVSVAGAYALMGQAAPAQTIDGASSQKTLRVQMEVKALKAPRVTDWSSIANTMRGTFEHLVEYNNDGSFRGMLLTHWDVNADATEYVLHIRPDVTWRNGQPLTAEQVAWNIQGWCDKSVVGNSMASRMASLIDPETGQAAAGAIVVEDGLTVRLSLPRSDISIIPSMADFPAAIVHPSFDDTDIPANVGTGPFQIDHIEVGEKAVLTRNADQDWWGTQVYGGPFVDRIEYLDYGTDPASWVAAIEAGEVDMLSESVGEFVGVLDAIGLAQSKVVTAATAVVRTNQKAKVGDIAPYADKRVRRALAMAVDPEIVLELGINDHGITAENHHVAPIHPDYAPLPKPKIDPEAAYALMAEAGMLDFEHELISLDDGWLRNTADAVGALLQDAGFKVKRRIMPGGTYWQDWATYPFSVTNWNHRALGVQILSVAYRSGEPWNETGFENAEFDALLDQALALSDVDERRQIMARIQQLMQDEGVIIQPYWRSLYRHARPDVTGADIHITLDHHHYKWGFA